MIPASFVSDDFPLLHLGGGGGGGGEATVTAQFPWFILHGDSHHCNVFPGLFYMVIVTTVTCSLVYFTW